MRRAAFLLCAGLLAGCTFTEDTAAPPSELPAYEYGARLERVWSQGTGNAFNERWVRMVPIERGETVYAANVGGQVTAYAADSGREQWRAELDTWLSSGLGGAGGAIYAGSAEGTLIALNADDGSERWRQDLGGELLAPPAARDGRLVVRTVDGRVLALDPADGSELWTYAADVPSLSLRGQDRPTLVPGGVLVGLDNGRVVGLAEQNGRPAWRTRVAEPSGPSPVQRMVDIDGALGIGASAIYAATYQGKVAQISPEQGDIRWERSMSSYAGLHLDGERVYVSNADSHVVALDPDSGATLWRQEKLAHRRLTAPVPIPGTDFLAVADYNGYVHILTRADGRIVNRDRAGDYGVLADPVALGEGRFAVQTQGADLTVYAVRPPE